MAPVRSAGWGTYGTCPDGVRSQVAQKVRSGDEIVVKGRGGASGMTLSCRNAETEPWKSAGFARLSRFVFLAVCEVPLLGIGFELLYQVAMDRGSLSIAILLIRTEKECLRHSKSRQPRPVQGSLWMRRAANDIVFNERHHQFSNLFFGVIGEKL